MVATSGTAAGCESIWLISRIEPRRFVTAFALACLGLAWTMFDGPALSCAGGVLAASVPVRSNMLMRFDRRL